MKLFIHIGMPKTGTSAIQHHLWQSRAELARQGILYPIVPKTGHAHTHLCMLHEGDRSPQFLLNRYADDPRSATQIGREILTELARQIESAAPDTHTVVLSSEAWFSRPRFACNEEFLTFIEDHFDDVECVCYVRKPSEYVMSAMQQNLKKSHELIKIVQPNYRGVFDRIAPRFRLNIRNFARDALDGGDVVNDFYRQFLGINAPALVAEAGRNESFSGAAMYLLREWRAGLPPQLWGVRNRDTIAVEQELRNADIEVGLGDRPRFLEPISLWLDRPTPGLAYLKEAFGIDLAPSGASEAAPKIGPLTPLEDIMGIDFDRVARLRAILADRGASL